MPFPLNIHIVAIYGDMHSVSRAIDEVTQQPKKKDEGQLIIELVKKYPVICVL